MQKCDVFGLVKEITNITEDVKTMSGKFVRNENQEIIFIQLNAVSFIADRVLPDFLQKTGTETMLSKPKRQGLPKAIQGQCDLIVQTLETLKEDWIKRNFVKKDESGAYCYSDDGCWNAAQPVKAILSVVKDMVTDIRYNSVPNLGNKSAYSFFKERADDMEQTIRELK